MNINSRISCLLAVFIVFPGYLLAQQSANDQEQTLRVYALKHLNCDSATQMITDLLDGPGVRMSPDIRTNSLIVRADEQSHKRIANLLLAADISTATPVSKERGNVSVQVLWVVDIPNQRLEDFETLKDPPGIISELLTGKLRDRLAISNPKLGTQLFLKCQPDEHGFGEVSGEGNGQLGDMHEFSISCNTYLEVKENDRYSIELDIVAKIDGKDSNVSTKIMTVGEHPVCLAIAPIGGIDSLFIVRVFND